MKTARDVKKRNVSAVLATIRQADSISKNEIAEALSLSSVTVHNIVNGLLASGACVATGEYASRGGRNAAKYRINSDYGVILGQRLTRRVLVTTVYDFSLRRLYRNERDCPLAPVSACVGVLCEALRDARAAAGEARVLGAGLSMPGRVDENGVVLHIQDVPAWNYVPLRERLEKETGLHFCVDGADNAMAVSSRWRGLSARFEEAVYMTICDELGTGVLLDGQLFRGSSGNGCEIGHTTIMFDGPQCACGNRGCAQAFVDTKAILTRFNKLCEQRRVEPAETIEETFERIEAHPDAGLRAVYENAFQYIAIVISHTVRIFDPEAIILRCEWLSRYPELFERLRAKVFADCKWLQPDRFTLLLDGDPEILESSAACLFLHEMYNRAEFL